MKINTLLRLVPKGKVFSVTFTKRDGTTRQMNCRTGVRKGIKGVERNYNPIDKNILIVYDMHKGDYRSIKSESIQSMKIEGTRFDIKN